MINWRVSVRQISLVTMAIDSRPIRFILNCLILAIKFNYSSTLFLFLSLVTLNDTNITADIDSQIL